MKNLLFISLLFFIVTFSSCEVDVPDTDTTPPQFSFLIKGDGLNRTFDQDDDFTSFQLNLRNGASYDFVLIASDAGGLAQMTWQIVPEYYDFEDPIALPWTSTMTSPLNRRIQWLGDRDNALTGTTLSGTFRVNGQNVGNAFRFLAKDFGGRTGTPNTFSVELNLYIGDHETKVIGL